MAAFDFCLSVEFVCALHALASKEEVLEWGQFRSGMVTIAGSEYLPSKVAELPFKFNEMDTSANSIDDVYDKAIHFIYLKRPITTA